MKEELDSYYAMPDPWSYTTTPSDIRRKQYIIHILNLFGPFSRALDIGAGEGWITSDIPASTRHGFEISDVAAARFPANVTRECSGQYDLVLATGVLYGHYAWQSFLAMIHDHASRFVVTCSIKPWEVKDAIHAMPGPQIFEAEFPYRVHTQKLRVFEVT